ncbi:MAG: acyl-CoA/acyl-ACP dehydrogenase [Proteobacteria bacterium]|jgi:acyl-CoA dehydrogenase|nr:acyl-CoA/acyl-ACP dehydrogenase [Pseudomonadota bacterium]MDA0959242.1 acyl-CoA/acyl-ACP dehydrogenase [Pseudomonadota bacterium]MDA1207664.1 acyl-CoA/acyl-ACP dehydrogenase [Pseudomonadota bacterium]
MNFDFSAEDRMVQEQVRRFLSEQSPLSRHRAVLEGETPHADDVWQGLAEMGLQGTAIPEAYGGVGAGYLPLCLVAQELGAVLAPVAFSSSVYLAAEALTLFGSTDQKERYLPRLASGEMIGTLAVNETLAETSMENLGVIRSGNAVTGKKLVVPHGLVADIAIVLARGEQGPELVIVSLADVHREVVETVDPSIAAATLEFSETPCEILSAEGNVAYQTLVNRAAVLLAFEQIGGAEQALNMAVAYAKERFAFGRPIGSFQALKHMMADMYVALKLAESNAYYAAWALQNDAEDLALAAATARVSATQAFQLCARDNIQVHGGMGFTWAFDCHLFYRRANYLSVAIGGNKTWEDHLINALPGLAA